MNLTSAGQFASLGIIAGQGTYLEMAIVELTVNIRYAFMSLSLSQKVDEKFKGIYKWLLSFFITDEIFEQEYTVTAVSTLLSGLAWMYDSSVDMGIAERSYQYDYMVIDSQSKGYGVLAIMLSIPVIIIVVGVVIWIRRKNA